MRRIPITFAMFQFPISGHLHSYRLSVSGTQDGKFSIIFFLNTSMLTVHSVWETLANRFFKYPISGHLHPYM